ncbi:MAG: UPF0175 family protein [Chloroflexota bacterium]
MAHQITLQIPNQTLLALKMPLEELKQELRLAAAIKLYEIGRLSCGAAAELAGIPEPLFLTRLADFGVDSFTLTEAELDIETRLI